MSRTALDVIMICADQHLGGLVLRLPRVAPLSLESTYSEGHGRSWIPGVGLGCYDYNVLQRYVFLSGHIYNQRVGGVWMLVRNIIVLHVISIS